MNVRLRTDVSYRMEQREAPPLANYCVLAPGNVTFEPALLRSRIATLKSLKPARMPSLK